MELRNFKRQEQLKELLLKEIHNFAFCGGILYPEFEALADHLADVVGKQNALED